MTQFWRQSSFAASPTNQLLVMSLPRPYPPEVEAIFRTRAKRALRLSMQRLRMLSPASARAAQSDAVCNRLRDFGIYDNVGTMGLYRPITHKGEVDTSAIAAEARRQGIRLAYPVLVDTNEANPLPNPQSNPQPEATGARARATGGILENDPAVRVARSSMASRWVDPDGDDALLFEDRGHGFLEPLLTTPPARPDELDVVIVPGLAYDPLGWRIGYGGGYYDRTIPLCAKAKTVGICFDFQVLLEIPRSPDDVSVDVVVTDKRTFVRPPSERDVDSA